MIELVSDGQHSIRLAMSWSVAGHPIPVLSVPQPKGYSRPVMELDRRLKTGLKKNLRGIRELKKQVQYEFSDEAEITIEYLAAVRSILPDNR
ncbi:hypothetical protein [Paenibacillus zanthoxyli]|uniref:hypothetical protein n=1 Tax=Paenibacillus zanthoxyli TaxID=369399 RepID=UPI0012EBCC7E|nr:hypothetical protein [Paenibacillus zanthoxyli]